MSREKCVRCDAVVSTTANPSSQGGWFVSERTWDEIEFAAGVKHRLSLFELRNSKAIRMALCAACQEELSE